jgi:hypothetical protein
MPLQAGRQSSQTPLTQINNINVKFMTRSGHYSHNVRSSLKNKLCCSAKPVRKCCSRVSIAGHPFPASSKLSLPRSHSANLAVQSISTEIAGAGSNACDALAQQLISESLSGTVRISSTFTSCIQEVSHLLHKQSHFYFIGRKVRFHRGLCTACRTRTGRCLRPLATGPSAVKWPLQVVFERAAWRLA